MPDKALNTTKSLAWSFFEQFGSRVIQLLVQIVLARLLSPDAFGVLAILLVVIQICDSVAQSGLGMALIQKSDATDRTYSTAWWMSIGFAFLLYIVIFVIAPTIATFYAIEGLDTFLRVMALIVFFNSANSIQRSYYQRAMNFRSIFYATTIAALVSGVAGIAFALQGGGVWSLVAQSLLQSILVCIIMLAQLPWRPTFEFDCAQARDLLSYGWKISVTGILNVFYSGVSELILGRTTSADQLGLYSQGRKYPIVAISVMTNAIANVLFPSFAETKYDRAAFRVKLREALSLGTFAIVAISMWLVVIAEPAVSILLTEKWLACVPIFMLTCISNTVLMFQLVNLRAYMALGDSGLYMRLQIIKVLGGGICIWLVAAVSHDIYFTAGATCVVGVFSVLLVDMPPAQRMHGYGAMAQLRDTAHIFLLGSFSLGISLLSCQFLSNEWVKLFVGTLVFSTSYFGGARLLRFPQLSKSIELLFRLVGKRSP